jgi:hypothetical protein
VKCDGSRLSSPLDAVDPEKTMRPKTTGNILVFQLIGHSFFWLGVYIETIESLGTDPDSRESFTIY